MRIGEILLTRLKKDDSYTAEVINPDGTRERIKPSRKINDLGEKEIKLLYKNSRKDSIEKLSKAHMISQKDVLKILLGRLA